MRAEFLLDPDVVFLNHGSFGACPRPVFERYQEWQRELERQPIDFIDRKLPGELAAARVRLAAFLGAETDDLVFVPNATSGVNLAARAVGLRPGDEVLATGLEYGACDLAWEHACARAGARYVCADVPLPLERPEQVVDALFARVSERTRVVFVSHVTSGTALVLPVEEIVRRARSLGLTTVVDGAHAPAQVPLDLDSLGADYYTGNCHKWMCAPKGAGFLHVRRELQDTVDALIVSWGYEDGGSFVARHEHQGTRDPAAYLTVPAAIEWLEANDLPAMQRRARELTRTGRAHLCEIDGVEPLAHESFLAQMASVRVPTDDTDTLYRGLLERGIEVPVVSRKAGPMLRFSVAPYTEESDLDALVAALPDLLRAAS